MAWPSKVEFPTLRSTLRLTVRIIAGGTARVRGTMRLEDD
jgi:hypothetical protein